jgi:hypothetical protein
MVLFSINYINSYDKIYFKKIENNQYLLDDGIRDTDDEWQQQVEDKMLEYYKIIGYNKLIFI